MLPGHWSNPNSKIKSIIFSEINWLKVWQKKLGGQIKKSDTDENLLGKNYEDPGLKPQTGNNGRYQIGAIQVKDWNLAKLDVVF